jgi:hypothetical protein
MGSLSHIVPCFSNFSTISYQIHAFSVHFPMCFFWQFLTFPHFPIPPPISPTRKMGIWRLTDARLVHACKNMAKMPRESHANPLETRGGGVAIPRCNAARCNAALKDLHGNTGRVWNLVEKSLVGGYQTVKRGPEASDGHTWSRNEPIETKVCSLGHPGPRTMRLYGTCKGEPGRGVGLGMEKWPCLEHSSTLESAHNMFALVTPTTQSCHPRRMSGRGTTGEHQMLMPWQELIRWQGPVPMCLPTGLASAL